jgi:cell division transport system permease protein
MKWIDVKRICNSGWVNFWRNGYVSLASVLVMTITLFMIGSVVFTRALLESTLNEIKNKVDITVSFVPEALEEDILNVKKQVETLPEVELVHYASREEVLADFKKRHENDETNLAALDELGKNPFGAVLNIKAKDPGHYESIANYLDSKPALSKDGSPIVEKVNYQKNKIVIDRLKSIIDTSDRLGFAVSIIFIVISIIITFNTIRLAIYGAREEISVMRLVGAKNNYIRGPFVVGGIIYGLIAGIFTIIIFYPITYWVGSKTEVFFASINLFSYYLSNFGQIFLLIIGSGVLIGAISSFLAVKKYLKV